MFKNANVSTNKVNVDTHETLCVLRTIGHTTMCLLLMTLVPVRKLCVNIYVSRNKRRNLWVGRCVSSWWPWFPSGNSVLIYMYIYIYICVYIPYTSSVIGRIYNGSVIQCWRGCTPSRSIGECAVPDLNAILCFLWFTNCVLLFDHNLILGCLWHYVSV